MNTKKLSPSEVRSINNKIRRTRQLRRRVSLFCLSILLVVLTFTISSNAKDVNEKTLFKYYKSVQIQTGETLEDIVDQYICDSKYTKAKFTSELMFTNNLEEDTPLIAGTYIIVPYYDEYHG